MSAHHWDIDGAFEGTFDGCGHTIRGIAYSRDHEGDAGLIACNKGTIRNLKLAGSVIVGNRYVGAIADSNMGTIENCYVADDVSIFASNSSDPSKA